MSNDLAFDSLIEQFHQVLDGLPDKRTGQNTTYSIKDAALSAFSVFFTQSPSFLAHQRTMKQNKGRSNAESIFGVEKVPGDNQIRNLLDPIAPDHLFPMFESVLSGLGVAEELDTFRSIKGDWHIALDGLTYFSSKKINVKYYSMYLVFNGTEWTQI